MNRLIISRLSLLGFAMVASTGLVAQESTGQIVGSVRTKAGEPVAGAEVRFTSPVLQGVRVVVTDAAGAFRAPLLPPGSYAISVIKVGFVGSKVEGAILGLGQVLRQDLLMAPVQQANAMVEVIANAAAVDKTDVKAATNITAEQMDVLPRFTRGMDTAAQLAPGVVLNTNQGSRIQIRGAQTTQNRFLLNGTDIADNVFGDTTGRGFFVDDSIAETQVIQSPVNARYGGFTGGVINAITKSGGNDFTGVFRANVSRPSWKAIRPSGQRPTQRDNPGTDDMSRAYTLWVGGPIIKDVLWFAASTKLDPVGATAQTLPNLTTAPNTGDPAPVPSYNVTANQPYTLLTANQFYELKLTYAVNANHTLELAGNRNKTDQNLRSYSNAAEINALVPQVSENSYYTLGYRGVLSTNANLEARYAKKHQVLSAGGNPVLGDIIRARYSTGTYFQFQNGTFDKTDGGDNRDIYTYMANLQWYSPQTALGTHTVDVGFELLKQERQAANAQSPTGRIFWVWGKAADGSYRAGSVDDGSTVLNRVALYSVDKGTAITKTDGFYVNDLWALNNFWQLNLGLRYDRSSSSDTLGSRTIQSSQMSPRTQLRWDIKGDQSWLVSLSWARYVGKLNDSFTNLFTRAGNPTSEHYIWNAGTQTGLTPALVTDLANYNLTATGLLQFSSPTVRVVDSSTKAPGNEETSLGLRRSYTDGSFLSFNYNQRKGRNFFNDYLYLNYETQVPLQSSTVPGQSAAARLTRWGTDTSLTRDYKGLEFEFMNRFNERWSLGGNYTYAILKGNGEGSEGSNPSVSGDVIADYESVHVGAGRDRSYYAPEGKLLGDVTHRMRFYMNYVNKSSQGAGFNASLLFNYDGGGVYSLTRSQAFEARTQAQANGSTVPLQYPNSYTRYFGPRGIGRYDDTFSFDLKVGYEVPIFKGARYFTEITVLNVFNHMQRVSYSTSAIAGNFTLATGGPTSDFLAQTLAVSAAGDKTGFGTYGFADYINGRSVSLSAGIKW